jgi:hypothetical protein
MRDEPARDETGRATLRAASSSSMPSVMVSIQLTRDRESLNLNDRRRELAEHGPAMIMTSLVRSRRQATAGDGWAAGHHEIRMPAQHVVVFFYQVLSGQSGAPVLLRPRGSDPRRRPTAGDIRPPAAVEGAGRGRHHNGHPSTTTRDQASPAPACGRAVRRPRQRWNCLSTLGSAPAEGFGRPGASAGGVPVVGGRHQN